MKQSIISYILKKKESTITNEKLKVRVKKSEGYGCQVKELLLDVQ